MDSTSILDPRIMKSSIAITIGAVAVLLGFVVHVFVIHMLIDAGQHALAFVSFGPLAFICALLPLALMSRLRPDWFKPGWLSTHLKR
jgi:hypothetical protein